MNLTSKELKSIRLQACAAWHLAWWDKVPHSQLAVRRPDVVHWYWDRLPQLENQP